MSSQSLRELRERSGHSATWCAEHVGGVSLRMWQYWELGEKQGLPVQAPIRVFQTMSALAESVQAVLRVHSL